jgi:hypothetical protein
MPAPVPHRTPLSEAALELGPPAAQPVGYGVLYMVAGLCAIIGAFAILPVRRVR